MNPSSLKNRRRKGTPVAPRILKALNSGETMLFRVLAKKSYCGPGDTIVLKELVAGDLVQQNLVDMKTAYRIGARNPTNEANVVYRITSKGRTAIRLLDSFPTLSHRELLGMSNPRYVSNLTGVSAALLRIHEKANLDGLSIKEIISLLGSQDKYIRALLQVMLSLGLVLKVEAEDALRIKSAFRAKCFYKLSEKGVGFAKDLAVFSIPPLTI